jgi:hypothetical protein
VRDVGNGIRAFAGVSIRRQGYPGTDRGHHETLRQ